MTSIGAWVYLMKPTEAADNVVGCSGVLGALVTTTTMATRLPPVPTVYQQTPRTLHHHTILPASKQSSNWHLLKAIPLSEQVLSGPWSCVARYLRHPTHHLPNRKAWADPVGGPRGRLHTPLVAAALQGDITPCGMTSDDESSWQSISSGCREQALYRVYVGQT